MTTEPTSSTTPNEPGREDEESENAFTVNVIIGLAGILALAVAFAMAGDTGELGAEPGEKKLPWATIVAVVGVFLFVLACGLEFPRLKKFVWQRRSGTALNVALMSILALALTGIVNYVSARHFSEWDWTRQGVYSISDESLQVAKNLTKPVRISVIWPQGEQGFDLVQRLLDHYRSKSDKIEVEYLDPLTSRDKFEARIQSLGLEGRDFEAMFGVGVQSGYYDSGKFKAEKSKHVPSNDFFEGAGFDPMTQKKGQRKFKGEQVLTNALIEVTESAKTKVYFLTGHGELDSEGQAQDEARGLRACGTLTRVLRSRNMEVATLDLTAVRQVPADATILVVAGPSVTLQPTEVAAIDGWLKEGGKLVALLPGPVKRDRENHVTQWLPTGLEGVLKRYGVELKNSAIMAIQPYGRGELEIVEFSLARLFDSSHKISAPLAGGQIQGFRSRVVKAEAEPGSPAKATEIVKVSTSWPRGSFFTVPDPEEFLGRRVAPEKAEQPQAPVVVASEQTIPAKNPGDPEKVTRVVVSGDSAWISNLFFDSGMNSNEALFLNIVSWLGGQERYTREPVREADYKLELSRGLQTLYTRLACPGMPFLALVIGVSVYLIRRR